MSKETEPPLGPQTGTWACRQHLDFSLATPCPTPATLLGTDSILTFIDFVIFSVHLGLQDVSFNEPFHDFLKCEHKEGIRQAWPHTVASSTVSTRPLPPAEPGQRL